MDSEYYNQNTSRSERKNRMAQDNKNLLYDSMTLMNSSKTLEVSDSRSRLNTTPDAINNSEFVLSEHRAKIEKIKQIMNKKNKAIVKIFAAILELFSSNWWYDNEKYVSSSDSRSFNTHGDAWTVLTSEI